MGFKGSIRGFKMLHYQMCSCPSKVIMMSSDLIKCIKIVIGSLDMLLLNGKIHILKLRK